MARKGALPIGQPRDRLLALPRLPAHHACAGRERAKFDRPLRYLEPELGVMEASRGSAEAAALSPEQAARYLRYVWAAGGSSSQALAGSGGGKPSDPPGGPDC